MIAQKNEMALCDEDYLNHTEYDGHKITYSFLEKEEHTYQALIATHGFCDNIGSHLGGVRIRPYDSLEKALTDVLRLSKAMTYKNIFADLKDDEGKFYAGGKTTVVANPKMDKTGAFFIWLAKFIEGRKGEYIGACDSGTTPEDMVELRRHTSHVRGLPKELGGCGNTNVPTARGVLYALEGILPIIFHDKINEEVSFEEKTRPLRNLKIFIQGIGSVGSIIADRLYKAGADLTISETVRDRRDNFMKTHLLAKFSADEAPLHCETDVFMPCAMGGILNKNTIPKLQCRLVLGCANNQCAEEEDYWRLQKAGIIYAPDFVVNAGGVIGCIIREEPALTEKLKNISRRLTALFGTNMTTGIPMAEVAEKYVDKKLINR